MPCLQAAAAERREYQQRLTAERTAARRAAARGGGLSSQPAVDHYRLLGLERGTTPEEVSEQHCWLPGQLHLLLHCWRRYCSSLLPVFLPLHHLNHPSASVASRAALPFSVLPCHILPAGAARIQKDGAAAASRQGGLCLPRGNPLLRLRFRGFRDGGCAGADAGARHLALQAAGWVVERGCVAACCVAVAARCYKPSNLLHCNPLHVAFPSQPVPFC